MFNSISFKEVRQIEQPVRLWYANMLSTRRRPRQLDSTIGMAVHLRLTGNRDDLEQARQLIGEIPRSTRAEAKKRVNDLVAAAELIRRQDPVDVVREREMHWQDPQTGWFLCSRVDTYWFDRAGALHLVDYKISARANPDHQSQLEFYSLVARRALEFTGPVKLHCRLLGSGDERIFQANENDDLLRDARAMILRYDGLTRSARQYIVSASPGADKLIADAFAAPTIQESLDRWYRLSCRCRVRWDLVHPRGFRCWQEVRKYPVRIARRMSRRNIPWTPDLFAIAAHGQRL